MPVDTRGKLKTLSIEWYGFILNANYFSLPFFAYVSDICMRVW